MVFVPLYEVGLLEIGMELELVDSWLDRGLMEELFQLMRREVGDANVANFASVEEPLHGEPGLRNIVNTACRDTRGTGNPRRHSQCSFSRLMRRQANALGRDRGIRGPSRSASHRVLAQPDYSDDLSVTMRQYRCTLESQARDKKNLLVVP